MVGERARYFIHSSSISFENLGGRSAETIALGLAHRRSSDQEVITKLVEKSFVARLVDHH